MISASSPSPAVNVKAVLHLSEADGAGVTVAHGPQQKPGGFDRVLWKAQRTGEDIGTAAGHGAEHRQGRLCAFCEQAVDHLVDCAIAAEGEDAVHCLFAGPGPTPA